MSKLTYEDCKELKDAGFPQMWTEEGDMMDDSFKEVVSKSTHSFVPTLSELIEACGDRLDRIESNYIEGKPIKWRAVARWVTIGRDGDSPEQAVKNLWLAINKKS